MRRLLTAFCLMSAACLTSTSHAQPSLQLKPLISYYDHREASENGQALNRETGYLQGLNLSAGYRLGSQWEWRVSGRWLTGSVDYDGETQAGSALATETHYDKARLGLELGFRANDLPLHLTGGLYNYRRQRDIRGSAQSHPLREEDTGWELQLSATHPLLTDRLWLSAGLLHRFERQLTSDLTHLGYGQPQLDLPEGWGGHAGMQWRMPDFGPMQSTLSLEYRYLKTPRSESVRTRNSSGTVLVLTQPETRLQQWHLGFNLRWQPK